MTKLIHSEIQELLGVYALDALDPDERLMVEQHLDDCPQCRSEVEAHRSVAAMLGNVGATAPDGIWDRIADSLEGEAQVVAFPLEGATAIRRARSARRRPVAIALGAVAAAAVLVVGLVGVTTIRHQQHQVDDLAAQVADTTAQRSAAEALADPASTVVRLTSPGDHLELRAVVTRDGVGYLLGGALPDLGRASTYQLWGATDTQTVSLGVMGREPGIFEFHLDDPVGALAITREQAGGVERSDNEPIVAGTIDANRDDANLPS